MQRMYYVLGKENGYYILSCASYGFDDDEEVMSSTNDVVCLDDIKLIVGKYVRFDNEKVDKTKDKYYVSGQAVIYDNQINDDDRKEYDIEFDLSIEAYKNNDELGIERWNNYLRTYEDKFMSFEKIENE